MYCTVCVDFPWNYTEEPKCGKPYGMDNWCMTEGYSFAHYRGFNYPHQIMSYYGMYRVARYHEKIPTIKSWQWYKRTLQIYIYTYIYHIPQ